MRSHASRVSPSRRPDAVDIVAFNREKAAAKPKHSYDYFAHPIPGRERLLLADASAQMQRGLRMVAAYGAQYVGDWIERVAETHPAEALRLWLQAAEYVLPRLARTEVSGDQRVLGVLILPQQQIDRVRAAVESEGGRIVDATVPELQAAGSDADTRHDDDRSRGTAHNASICRITMTDDDDRSRQVAEHLAIVSEPDESENQ